ncbi:hypothetical protein [Streptomyces yanii]|uniref:VOC domain-containing protein n=1 Tax=Streptomyces yanii TaxID=78510 RepID=A0ABV5R859_9ACTN
MHATTPVLNGGLDHIAIRVHDTHEIASCAGEFCGHNGVMWLRPERARGFTTMPFASPARSASWRGFGSRSVRSGSGACTASPTKSPPAPPQTTRTETWFSLPEQPVTTPPKWKATLVTMLGAYPVAYGIKWLLGPQITAWPLPCALWPSPLTWLYPDANR